MFNEDQFFQDTFETPSIEDSNPLDFLVMDGFDLKRKPRSSLEHEERLLEIPACQPSYTRFRDSGRSRGDCISP